MPHFLQQYKKKQVMIQTNCILALCFSIIVSASSRRDATMGTLRGSTTARALNNNLISCVDNVCKTGLHKFHFNYSFVDGCVLQGYTKYTDLQLKYCDGSSIRIDISCTSEYSKEGFSTVPGFGPTKGQNPAISQYTIKTLQSDCACAQYCLHTAPTAPNLIPSLPFDFVCEEVASFDGFRCINGECVENVNQESSITPLRETNPTSEIPMKPSEAADGSSKVLQNGSVETVMTSAGDASSPAPEESTTYTVTGSKVLQESFNQSIYSYSSYNTSVTFMGTATTTEVITTSQPEQVISSGSQSSEYLAYVQFNVTSSSAAMMDTMKNAEIRYELLTVDQKVIATQTCKCQSVIFSNITQGTYELVYTISGYGTFNTTVTVQINDSGTSTSDLATTGSISV